uniref:Microsomal glutathione S-transferase 1 n=1 Tax=Culicoides sonorensis TaxID=179676 RepID=A0A336LIS8_CULSO
MSNHTEIYQLISVKNDAFGTYAFWAGILVAISEEDLKIFRGGQVITDDPSVERARNAHRNDLENILPYLIIGFLFIFTDPNTTAAMWLYRIGAISRLLHTCVYAFVPVPQPARSICFFTTAGIMVYMSCLEYTNDTGKIIQNFHMSNNFKCMSIIKNNINLIHVNINNREE